MDPTRLSRRTREALENLPAEKRTLAEEAIARTQTLEARARDASDRALLDQEYRETGRIGTISEKVDPADAAMFRKFIEDLRGALGSKLEPRNAFHEIQARQGCSQPPGIRQAGKPDRRNADAVRTGIRDAGNLLPGAESSRGRGESDGRPDLMIQEGRGRPISALCHGTRDSGLEAGGTTRIRLPSPELVCLVNVIGGHLFSQRVQSSLRAGRSGRRFPCSSSCFNHSRAPTLIFRKRGSHRRVNLTSYEPDGGPASPADTPSSDLPDRPDPATEIRAYHGRLPGEIPAVLEAPGEIQVPRHSMLNPRDQVWCHRNPPARN